MKSGEGSFLHSVEHRIDDAIERMDLVPGLVDQAAPANPRTTAYIVAIDKVPRYYVEYLL